MAQDEQGHGRCSAACGGEGDNFFELVGASISNNAPDEASVTTTEDVFVNNNIVTENDFDVEVDTIDKPHDKDRETKETLNVSTRLRLGRK